MNLNETRLKATELAQEARSKLEAADVNSPDYAEINVEIDRILAESDKLAERANKLEAAEKREKSYDQIVTDLGNSATTVEARAAVSEKAEKLFDGYVRGAVSEFEMRNQIVGDNAAGGFTVPTQLEAAIIKAKKAYGPLNEGGPVTYRVTTSGNPIKINYNDDTARRGRQVAEGESANAAQDLTYSQVTLGSYKFTSDVFTISRELMRDSNTDMTAEISGAAAERLGRTLNESFTNGNGTSGPQGIVTAAGVGKTTALATAIALDDLIDLEHSVDPAYRQGSAYMWSDPVFASLRKMKDAEGRLLWQANYVGGAPATFNMRPYYINNDMAGIETGKKSVIYGDLSKFVVRRVAGLSLQRLNELYALADMVGFLAFVSVDSKLTDARAVKALKQA